MSEVTGGLIGPDQAPLSAAEVMFALVDAAGIPVEQAWLAAENRTVVGESRAVNSGGQYLIDVPGNADVTPAGTRWRRSVRHQGRVHSTLLVVPTSGGPYPEDDLVVIPSTPSTVPPAQGQLAFTRLEGAPNTTVDTTSTSVDAIPGFSAAFVARGRPVSLRAHISHTYTSGASVGIRYFLYLDGAGVIEREDVVGTAMRGLHLEDVRTPAAGPHTLEVRWQLTVAGTGKLVPTSYLGLPCSAWLEVVER